MNRRINSAPRPLPLLVLLLGILISSPTHTAEVKLPDLGLSASSVFSPELDRRIGAAFMRQVRATMRVVDEPELQAYVRTLGLNLASRSHSPELRFHFFLVDNPVINAFAGPGGNIGIHSGLVNISESESELASVFAHEISHVTQRHLPRAFERQSQMSTPTLAAMIGALILTAASPEAGQAALLAVQGGSAQMQIDFTRHNEKEADRVGLQLLHQAGFDPAAMPGFFGRMAEASKFSRGRDIPEFLLTHPVTRDRISESLARVEKLPKQPHSDSLGYRHFTARVKATLGSQRPGEAIAQIQAQLETAADFEQPPLRYGYAYALLEARDFTHAGKQVDWLVARAPEFMPYRILKTRLQLERRDHSAGLETVTQALELFPGNDSLVRLHAEALLLNGKLKQAQETAQAYIAQNHADPGGYQLAARIAAATREPILAYQMEAEYHYWGGDLRQGIAALREAARQDQVDFITLTKIENRLRFFQSELAAEEELFGR